MEPKSNSSSVEVNGYSHFGKAKGRYYEDRIKFGPVITRAGLSLTLGIVADGIGGENAGERAATLTADGVFQFCQDSEESDIPGMLKTALVKVNAEVFKEAQQQATKKNMGSTAAVAVIYSNRLYVANVGDSRIYLVRGGKITQLTVDHTWEREVVQAKKLGAAEAARHPRRDELVRSIGYESTVKVDLGLYFNGPNMSESEASRSQGLPLQPGDRVVVCSDGLVKSIPKGNGHFVELPEIVKTVTEAPTADVPNQLVQRALDRNVDDNVSVIVMEVPGGRRPVRLPRASLPIAAAVIVLAFLGLILAPQILNPPPPPQAPLPTISVNQIFVSQVWNTSLRVLTTDNVSSQPSNGTFLDFKTGETLTTTGTGNGYARIGLSQAEVYLADGTEIIIKDPINILLNRGYLLIDLPSPLTSGQHFLVETPEGSQAWVSGSMMGLQYDPLKHELYFDCLQDVCGYFSNGLSQTLTQGSHVILNGTQVVSTGPGTRNEMWQFAPEKVATPTVTPSATPNAKATQTCKYYKSLGTPCPPP